MSAYTFDKSIFSEQFQANAIEVDLHLLAGFLNTYHPQPILSFLLNRPGISNVALAPTFEKRYILITPNLQNKNILQKVLETNNHRLFPYTVSISYENYDAQQAMEMYFLKIARKPVADDLEVTDRPQIETLVPPSNFFTIAHIACVTIQRRHLQHQQVIGSILLDKSNKTTAAGILDDNVIILAGDPNLDIFIKEGSCFFNYNFAVAPLAGLFQNERERVLRKLRKGEVVCDTMPEVGQLPILAARKGCKVLASVANASCFEFIKRNITRNECENIELLDLPHQAVIDKLIQEKVQVDHIIMHVAENFYELEALSGAYRDFQGAKMPLIHFYSHCANLRPFEAIYKQLSSAWACNIPKGHIKEVKHVLGTIFCTTVLLPQEVAFNNTEIVDSEGTVSDNEEEARVGNPLIQSMQNDLKFMRESIIQSQNLNRSLMVASLPNIIKPRPVIRQRDDDEPDSPGKRPKIQE